MARPAKRAPTVEPDVSRETSEPEEVEREPLPTPEGLSAGGELLWVEVSKAHELDMVQRVTLEEACRMKDRLDKLDRLLRRDIDAWASLRDTSPSWSEDENIEVVFDDAVAKANQTANTMKQLLAALRLPDASGVRPQQRGGARGAYVSGGADSGADKPGTGSGSTLGNLRGITGGRSA